MTYPETRNNPREKCGANGRAATHLEKSFVLFQVPTNAAAAAAVSSCIGCIIASEPNYLPYVKTNVPFGIWSPAAMEAGGLRDDSGSDTTSISEVHIRLDAPVSRSESMS